MSDGPLAIFQAYLLLIGPHWHSRERLPMHHGSSLHCSWARPLLQLCVSCASQRVLVMNCCRWMLIWNSLRAFVVIQCGKSASFQGSGPRHLPCSLKCELRRSDQFGVCCWCEESLSGLLKVTTELLPRDAAVRSHPVHLGPPLIWCLLKNVHLWQVQIYSVLATISAWRLSFTKKNCRVLRFPCVN